MSDSAEAEPSVYRDIKKVIFMIIYDKYGVDGWTKYWDALRRFINAEISREEMEAVVRFYLPKDKMVYHNRFFVLIICNIHRRGTLSSGGVRR